MNFYISDTHRNHFNIIRYTNRPFATVKEMDRVLLDNINAKVGEDDWLYHLGDWAWGDRRTKYGHLNNAIEFRQEIRCRNVVLIWGNHDQRLRRHRSFTSLFREIADLLEISDPFLQRNIVLCHYPMLSYNKSHHGNLHLFGHCHCNLNSWLEEHLPGYLAMDVGVDNAYRILKKYEPFSSQELKSLFNI